MHRIKGLATHVPRGLRAAAGIAVAGIALTPIAWVLYTQWPEVEPYLLEASGMGLLRALGLAVLGLGILGSTWPLIARRLGIALGFAPDLRAFFLSNFLKRAPGMVWYVAGRAYLYRTAPGGVWMVTTATMLENALLLLTGLILALILWPRQLGLPGSWISATMLVSVCIVAALSLYPTGILRLARRFRHGESGDAVPVGGMRLPPANVLSWMGLYALAWIIGGFSLHCFVVAFYPPLSSASLPFTVGVAIVYTLTGFVAFLIPAGLGVKELAGAYLLARVVPTPLAVAVILLFRLNLLVAEAIWLALSYSLDRWGTHLPKSKHESTQVRDEV